MEFISSVRLISSVRNLKVTPKRGFIGESVFMSQQLEGYYGGISVRHSVIYEMSPQLRIVTTTYKTKAIPIGEN